MQNGPTLQFFEVKNMIDIIVLTFNQEEHTIKCLESIREHTDNYRLVWVDNGSSIKSRQKVMPYFCKHKKRLSLWIQKNLGFVGGINAGLDNLMNVQKIKSKYIVLQNNDTIVTKGWLSSMSKILEDHPNIAAVGPVSSVEKSVHCFKRLCEENNLRCDPSFYLMNREDRSEYLKSNFKNMFCEAIENLKPPKVKMIAFFSSIIRRSVFEEVGILDDNYGVGLCDDRDYCQRLYDVGYTCAVALDSYVEHNHSTTFKSTFKPFQIEKIYKDNLNKFKEKHKL